MVGIFGTDGSIEVRSTMTFAEAQAAVGGFVEVVPTDDGVLLVNEEGRLRGMEPNLNASYTFGRMLVGPVVSLTGSDVDAVLGSGDSTD